MKTFDTVFGLAFNMEHSAGTASGYKPGADHLGRDFANDMRIKGFAALLEGGFTKKLIILGATAGNVHSAVAIRESLIHDFGVSANNVEAYAGESATTGAHPHDIAAILAERKIDPAVCAVVSSFQHVPRVAYFLAESKLALMVVPAESVWLAGSPEGRSRGEELLLATFNKETVREIRGIADLLSGIYTSKK